MNVYTCFREVSKSGGGKSGKSCCLHHCLQVVTPNQASSLELQHALEDNRGKLQRKALLWLRPEPLGYVCGGFVVAERTLRLTIWKAGQPQWERPKKKLYMPEANPGRICYASAQDNNHKKPCLCAWIYGHLSIICIQTSITTLVQRCNHLELSSSVSSSHLRQKQPWPLSFQNAAGSTFYCLHNSLEVRALALEIRDHFNSLLSWKNQWFQ